MVNRNDPCPCGSGRKYKKCCWAKDQAEQAAVSLATPLPETEEPETQDVVHTPEPRPAPRVEPPLPEPEPDPRMDALNARWDEFETRDYDDRIRRLRAAGRGPAGHTSPIGPVVADRVRHHAGGRGAGSRGRPAFLPKAAQTGPSPAAASALPGCADVRQVSRQINRVLRCSLLQGDGRDRAASRLVPVPGGPRAGRIGTGGTMAGPARRYPHAVSRTAGGGPHSPAAQGERRLSVEGPCSRMTWTILRGPPSRTGTAAQAVVRRPRASASSRAALGLGLITVGVGFKVAFIGTGMEDRHAFMMELLQRII
jgi:hypothetical protein